MPYWVVIREPGAAWEHGRPMRAQREWPAHAEFMNGLAGEGFVLIGGPLGAEEQFLLVVEAESEVEIRRRLDQDPWTPGELLRIDRIAPWQILLGEPRT